MEQRSQRTIARAVEVTGIGYLTGADVRLRFLPAAPHAGVAFLRSDLPGAEPVPALVEFSPPRERRTALQRGGATIEMTEHVLAALSALRIDNCLVELNAPENPGCDGSSQWFANALCDAGVVDQKVPRRSLVIQQEVRVQNQDGSQWIRSRPASSPGTLDITYHLDYGAGSPIPRQSYQARVTPESFLNDIAFARTFVLSREADALRAQGYGRRTGPRDLLIFGDQGVIENTLRAPDECARHKLLDCIGDFALLGCDLIGTVEAHRSGHRLNAELVRRLKLAHAATPVAPAVRQAA